MTPVGALSDIDWLFASRDFHFYAALGDKYAAEFNTDKALEAYGEAYELDPKNLDYAIKFLRANNSVGQYLRDQDADPEKVEAYFKRNVELAEKIHTDYPDRAESLFSLAIAYGNLALYSSPREKVKLAQDVEKNLKRSIELDPQFPYAYLGLAIFYREVASMTFLERFFADLFLGEVPKSSYAEAEKFFFASLEKDPNFIFTHYHLAICYERDGKTDEAAARYRKVLELPRSDYGDPILKKNAEAALKRMGSPIILSAGAQEAAPAETE